ncbi:hypothetical protein Yalta_122 [Yalta virus]|nr:hypothetical protein Yalta_122 [Yalta virus]
MLNPVFHRKLYFGHEIYYCLKDVLRSLQTNLDNDTFISFIENLNSNKIYTINHLQQRYIDFGFKSYVKEDLNRILITYLKKNQKEYRFVNIRYVILLLKKLNIDPNCFKQKLNVIKYLQEFFKHENYQVNYSIIGYEVEFYLVDYNIVVQPSTSYTQYQTEKDLKKKIKCTFIHYNVYNKNFDIFLLINKILDLMYRIDKKKYKSRY